MTEHKSECCGAKVTEEPNFFCTKCNKLCEISSPSPEGKGMKHLSFDCLSSQVKAHPQQVMKSLGITYEQVVPNSLYDRWWFFNCKNIPTPLPSYLKSFEESGIEAKDCVGHGLSKEDAEHFTNSPSPEKEPCETWEEEFDNEFLDGENWVVKYNEEEPHQITPKQVKHFIRQLLLPSRQEADQRVAKMVETCNCAIAVAEEKEKLLGIIEEMSEGDGKPKNDTMEIHQAIAYTDGYNQALADLQAKIK